MDGQQNIKFSQTLPSKPNLILVYSRHGVTSYIHTEQYCIRTLG